MHKRSDFPEHAADMEMAKTWKHVSQNMQILTEDIVHTKIFEKENTAMPKCRAAGGGGESDSAAPTNQNKRYA